MFRKKTVSLGVPILTHLFLNYHTFSDCFFSTSLPKNMGFPPFYDSPFLASSHPPTIPPRPPTGDPPLPPTGGEFASKGSGSLQWSSLRSFEPSKLPSASGGVCCQPIPTPPALWGRQTAFGDFLFFEPAVDLGSKKYTRWFPVGCCCCCCCCSFFLPMSWLDPRFTVYHFCWGLGRKLEGNSEGRLFFFRLKKKTVVGFSKKT